MGQARDLGKEGIKRHEIPDHRDLELLVMPPDPQDDLRAERVWIDAVDIAMRDREPHPTAIHPRDATNPPVGERDLETVGAPHPTSHGYCGGNGKQRNDITAHTTCLWRSVNIAMANMAARPITMTGTMLRPASRKRKKALSQDLFRQVLFRQFRLHPNAGRNTASLHFGPISPRAAKPPRKAITCDGTGGLCITKPGSDTMGGRHALRPRKRSGWASSIFVDAAGHADHDPQHRVGPDELFHGPAAETGAPDLRGGAVSNTPARQSHLSRP